MNTTSVCKKQDQQRQQKFAFTIHWRNKNNTPSNTFFTTTKILVVTNVLYLKYLIWPFIEISNLYIGNDLILSNYEFLNHKKTMHSSMNLPVWLAIYSFFVIIQAYAKIICKLLLQFEWTGHNILYRFVIQKYVWHSWLMSLRFDVE